MWDIASIVSPMNSATAIENFPVNGEISNANGGILSAPSPTIPPNRHLRNEERSHCLSLLPLSNKSPRRRRPIRLKPRGKLPRNQVNPSKSKKPRQGDVTEADEVKGPRNGRARSLQQKGDNKVLKAARMTARILPNVRVCRIDRTFLHKRSSLPRQIARVSPSVQGKLIARIARDAATNQTFPDDPIPRMPAPADKLANLAHRKHQIDQRFQIPLNGGRCKIDQANQVNLSNRVKPIDRLENDRTSHVLASAHAMTQVGQIKASREPTAAPPGRVAQMLVPRDAIGAGCGADHSIDFLLAENDRTPRIAGQRGRLIGQINRMPMLQCPTVVPVHNDRKPSVRAAICLPLAAQAAKIRAPTNRIPTRANLMRTLDGRIQT